ncbi:uncharacterized protein LOC110907064 [Helianthus annuus]|uniref:uncharacterized protein LOC110907064 n=1 Tax=Helianthus annuus TaxID=4232 RepID=UPI000B903E95|nr:uncharacterized protein LOC110907064 [Helianthus annuus]
MWNNWVPKKVAIVAWRAEMDRLPSKCALLRRNIPVQNDQCVFCGECSETSEHIFLTCQFAQIVWQIIADWCNIPPIFAFDISDLLSPTGVPASSRKKWKAVHAIVLVTFWCLWKMRNESVHRQGVPNVTRIVDEVKAMAFLWVKNRSKLAALTWEKWCRFDVGG